MLNNEKQTTKPSGVAMRDCTKCMPSKINKSAGRDHWGPLSTLMLVGGGLKMGRVVGESSPRAEYPATKPVSPLDLFATMFHVLGIDGTAPASATLNGRPVFPEPYTGTPIAELI